MMLYVHPHLIVENRSVTDMEKYSGACEPNTVVSSNPNSVETQSV